MQRITGNQAHELMEAYQSIYEPQELTEEQTIQFFNLWVDGLLNEGHDLSQFTYDELYDCYINESWGKVFADAIRAGLRSGFGLGGGSLRKAMVSRAVEGGTRSGAHLTKALKNLAIGSSAKNTGGKRRLALAALAADQLLNQGKVTNSIVNTVQGWSGNKPQQSAPAPESRTPKPKLYIPPSSLTDETDVVDLVKGYLMSERYVDNDEDAYKIMANMSEEWLEDIINSYTYIEG